MTATAAQKLEDIQTRLESGWVERVTPQLDVRIGRSVYTARRAKSCLVAPDVGDKVLCAIDGQQVYLLSVLEGRDGAATAIDAEGDLEIKASGGRVTVCASDGVDLVSGDDLSMTAREVNVRGQRCTVAIGELGFSGTRLDAGIQRISLVAGEVDQVLTRLSQRMKRAFKTVEEIDQTRAGTIDMRAEKLVGVRGETVVVAARVLTKVDGEQIHLG